MRLNAFNLLYQFLPYIHMQDSKQLKYPPLFFLIEKVPKSLAVKLAFTRLILPRPGKILAGTQVGDGAGEFRGSSSSSWRRKQKLEASLRQHFPSPTLTLSSMARSSRHIHGASSLGDDLLFSYSTGNFSLSQHTAIQCCSYSDSTVTRYQSFIIPTYPHLHFLFPNNASAPFQWVRVYESQFWRELYQREVSKTTTPRFKDSLRRLTGSCYYSVPWLGGGYIGLSTWENSSSCVFINHAFFYMYNSISLLRNKKMVKISILFTSLYFFIMQHFLIYLVLSFYCYENTKELTVPIYK